MSGTITLNENSFLELEKVESYLCSECLTEIMKGYYEEERWDIAVVDFFTKEVYPLNESVTAFFRDDYYVDCLYNKDRNTIMFQVFYCPERYSVYTSIASIAIKHKFLLGKITFAISKY